MVGKVIGGALRLRSMASTSGAIVYSIPDGSTVEVDLCSNQQWFRAVYSGYSGYVMSQYIHVTGGGTNATMTTSSDPLNIRALPSTSSSILFTASKGMAVKVLESSSGFYRISCSLGTGWGSSQYITLGGGGSGDNTDNWSVRYVNVPVNQTVNIREGASTNYDVAYRWPRGTKCLCETPSATWTKTKHASKNEIGFVMTSYLSTSNPDGSISNEYIPGNYCTLTANANLRDDASTSAYNNGTFATGSQFVIDGTKSGTSVNGNSVWVRIKYGSNKLNVLGENNVRYVHSEYVAGASFGPSNNRTAIVTVAQTLKGRTGGNLSLAGSWCQNFLYWLCYSVGMSNLASKGIPVGYGVTGDAIEHLGTRYKPYSQFASFQPRPGDWIYYLNEGSTDRASHVGLIVETDGQYRVRTIEGNLSNKVTELDFFDIRYTLTVNNIHKNVIGIARIDY